MRTGLKKFRIGVHLTQGEFAAKVGVSRQTYSYIERGLRMGGAKFWESVQREFNVSAADMWELMRKEETV